jgi:lysozyme family protein
VIRSVESILSSLCDREGGYVNHAADRGGPTCWGITEHVARAYGYTGDMHDLPRTTAEAIYRERYWLAPKFDQVASRSMMLGEELLDTGVNMGPSVAAKFLQRSLNALNRQATAYPDIAVDGAIGRMTLHALDQYIAKRAGEGVLVLFRLLNALQAARYVEIAESNPTQEAFVYGWLRTRVA